MPGSHSVVWTSAALTRSSKRHQQWRRHPQERMKKLQVRLQPVKFLPLYKCQFWFGCFCLSLLELSSFQVCPSVFEVPDSYHRRGGSRHAPVSSNDEELLQYAIHQSLLESRRAPSQVRTPPPPLLLSSPFTQFFYHLCSLCCFDLWYCWHLCPCRKWSGRIQTLMSWPEARVTGGNKGWGCLLFKQFLLVCDKRFFSMHVILEASQRGRRWSTETPPAPPAPCQPPALTPISASPWNSLRRLKQRRRRWGSRRRRSWREYCSYRLLRSRKEQEGIITILLTSADPEATATPQSSSLTTVVIYATANLFL